MTRESIQNKISELFDWLFVGNGEVLKRILVVEDDLDYRPVVSNIIAQINPDVDLSWVTSTEDALATLSEADQAFDLLITDVLLSGTGTGTDLYKVCKDMYPEMPVMIISGMKKETVEKQSGMELSTFLEKPIIPSECTDSIENLMKEKAWRKMLWMGYLLML